MAPIFAAIAAVGIPTIISTIGTVTSVAGQLRAADAARQAGDAALAMRIRESQILEEQAGQQKAAAQRSAMEERRRARLVASRAQALAAGSGAGVSDPTVANLLADISGEGAYRAAVELYEGEEAARQLGMEGAARVQRGLTEQQAERNRASALETGALTSLISGGASLYDKYKGTATPVSQSALVRSDRYYDAGTPGLYPYG